MPPGSADDEIDELKGRLAHLDYLVAETVLGPNVETGPSDEEIETDLQQLRVDLANLDTRGRETHAKDVLLEYTEYVEALLEVFRAFTEARQAKAP